MYFCAEACLPVYVDVFFQPVSQDVQHSLGGDEGAIGGEKDGNKGGVSHGEGVEKVQD